MEHVNSLLMAASEQFVLVTPYCIGNCSFIGVYYGILEDRSQDFPIVAYTDP